MKWETIDEQYSFSLVFQGNFGLKLYPEKEKGQYVEQKDKTFLGLIDGTSYVIEVEEDAEAESKIEKTTYKAVVIEEKKTNNKVKELTDELKGMTLEEIEAKGAKF